MDIAYHLSQNEPNTMNGWAKVNKGIAKQSSYTVKVL